MWDYLPPGEAGSGAISASLGPARNKKDPNLVLWGYLLALAYPILGPPTAKLRRVGTCGRDGTSTATTCFGVHVLRLGYMTALPPTSICRATAPQARRKRNTWTDSIAIAVPKAIRSTLGGTCWPQEC